MRGSSLSACCVASRLAGERGGEGLRAWKVGSGGGSQLSSDRPSSTWPGEDPRRPTACLGHLASAASPRPPRLGPSLPSLCGRHVFVTSPERMAARRPARAGRPALRPPHPAAQAQAQQARWPGRGGWLWRATEVVVARLFRVLVLVASPHLLIPLTQKHCTIVDRCTSMYCLARYARLLSFGWGRDGIGSQIMLKCIEAMHGTCCNALPRLVGYSAYLPG